MDCDLWVGDTFDVAVTEDEAAAFKLSYELLKSHGGDVSHIEYINDPAEAQKVFKTLSRFSCTFLIISQVSRINGALACVRWTAGTFYPWKFGEDITIPAAFVEFMISSCPCNQTVSQIRSEPPNLDSRRICHRWIATRSMVC